MLLQGAASVILDWHTLKVYYKEMMTTSTVLILLHFYLIQGNDKDLKMVLKCFLLKLLQGNCKDL